MIAFNISLSLSLSSWFFPKDIVNHRSGKELKKGTLSLERDWKKTDVSWRWSLKSLSPNPSIIGDDLDLDGRKRLGLERRYVDVPRHAFVVQPLARAPVVKVEPNVLRLGGRIELHRDAHQPEADAASPHRLTHRLPPTLQTAERPP